MTTKQTSQNADEFYQNLVVRHKLAAGQITASSVTANMADVNYLTVNGFLTLKQDLVATVQSISALRTFVRDNFEAVVVTGYYTANDGGGGVYQYSATSAAADNGGSVIVSEDGSHWLLVTDGTFNVKQWGATGDGLVEDTKAVQTALDAAFAYGDGKIVTVVFPTGTYMLNNVSVPVNMHLVGYGATIIASADPLVTTNYFFSLVGGSNTQLTIEGFFFDSDNMTSVGGTGGLPCCAIFRGVTEPGINNVTITNNKFLYTQASLAIPQITAVGLNGVVSGIISYNFAQGYTGDTLNINYSNCVFEGNLVRNGGDGGIAVNNQSTATIVGNYVFMCNLGIGSGPISAVSDLSYHLTVTGNTFDGCDYGINMGWFAYAGQKGPGNWLISGNNFRRMRTHGIAVNEQNAFTVINGTISGNSFTGGGSTQFNGTVGTYYTDIELVNVTNIVVTGNQFSELATTAPTSDTHNLYIQGSAIISVTGNTFSSTTTPHYDVGVLLRQGSNNVTISGNIFWGQNTGVQMGFVSPSENVSVINVVSNSFTNYFHRAVIAYNSSNYLSVTSNAMLSNVSDDYSVNFSAGNDLFQIMNNMITPANTNCITVNTNVLRYNVSYNTVFGGTIVGGSGVGYQTTGNF